MNYHIALKNIFPNAEAEDWNIQDDGQGPYIKYFNAAKLGALPTAEQLAQAESAALAAMATKEQTLNDLKSLKVKPLSEWTAEEKDKLLEALFNKLF